MLMMPEQCRFAVLMNAASALASTWGDYHLNHQQGETWLRVKGEKVLNVKEMKLSGT